jgi:hypothetical protein
VAESYELATGYVSLSLTTRDMGRQVVREFSGVEKQADKAGQRAGKRFGSTFGGAAKGLIAGAAGLFAAQNVVGFFKDANAEAREAQKVGATTAQVIAATGGAAKVSADQVGALATAISNKTGVDDEAIQSGANLLLTFKNVRNEVGQGANIFDRATQAATDLSAGGFGSVAGASKMLGKALNDPVKGISALSRAGVTFTDQQKEQIKTLVASGRTLDAQKIILGEVESQVGGVAAASATAGEKLSVSFGNFKEQVGTALLPVIDDVANVLTTKVIPAVSGFITEMQDGTGRGGQFVDFLKGAGNALQTTYGFIKDNADVIVPLVAGVAAGVVVFKTITGVVKAFTAVQAALNVVMAMNPIGLVIIAIAALVTALVIAYKKNETFRQVVQAVWAGIKKAVGATVDWFKRAVPAAVDWVKNKWAATKEAFLAPIRFVRDKLGDILGQVRGKFASAVSAIGRAWDRLKEVAKAPISFVINTVLNNGLIAAFNKIARVLPGVGELPTISVPGFHAGGWTGPGGKMQPAGIVHADEFVINKASRQRIERDAPGLLNWLNGYATGGLVGGSGSFTDLFASRLLLAQQLAGQQFHIFQRGFRPATSYSGTSHQGDAVDLGPVRGAIVAALRRVGIAAWDRTGKGNWVPHIHGVPLPGAGRAAGSAVWQAQDYLRGGDGLGGRDNGPRVGVLGKIGAFLKAGFSSFADWFENLVKDPLAKLNGIANSPFGRLAAAPPRMLVEGMVDRVAKFDTGGVLKPGLTLAYNGTGRDERVLTAGQMRTGGVTINGGNFGYSPDEIAEAIERRRRRQELMRAPQLATA